MKTQFKTLVEKIVTADFDPEGIKRAVFAFGRMNPPTKGHKIVIDKVMQIAKIEHREPFIFLTKVCDNKKSPIPYNIKLDIMNRSFPDIPFVHSDFVRNAFEATYFLRDKGYKDVVMICGSDRIALFEQKMRPYVMHSDPTKSMEFTSFKIETAGNIRDPDSEDIAGMSSTTARTAALNGEYHKFSKILPDEIDESSKKRMYDIIRETIRQ